MKINLPRSRLRPRLPVDRQERAAGMEMAGLALIVMACALVWLPLAVGVAGALLVLLAQGMAHNDATE